MIRIILDYPRLEAPVLIIASSKTENSCTENSSVALQLFFVSGPDSVELERTIFTDSSLGFQRTAFRAKSSSSGRTTFRWTTAVQGLALLMVKAAHYRCKGIDPASATLEGDKESLAASLDYALSKQPAWMHDMFGASVTGDARLRDWIVRINSGRRRLGPVTLSLNTDQLNADNIEVFVDGIAVQNVWAFRALISGLHLSTVTEPQEENVVALPPSSESPFRAATIQPAGLEDIERIHAYERVEFPGCHATLDRLVEWRNHDPAHFSILKYPGEDFLAYYILLFPKQESLNAFRQGHLQEDDMGPDQLVAPTTNAYLSCTAAHICAVAWKQGAAFFGMDLFGSVAKIGRKI